MKPTLTLTALALVLAAVPALASPERGGARAMLQTLTFAEVDADGDGGVTLEEWRSFLAARGDALRAERVSARVAELMAGDADGDGLLSAQELSARMAALHEERRAARAEWREARRAERAEGRGWGRHEGRHEDRRAGRRGEDRGWDRRGGRGLGMDAASADERIVRSFQRIDRDGDGRLTEAEFERARAEMQARIERHEARRGPRGG